MQNILPDIPRIWTAIAEWGSCLVYIFLSQRGNINSHRRRIHPWWICAAALPVFTLFQSFLGTLPTSFWILGMVGAASMMWGLLKLATPAHTPSLFLLARAFVLAELVASFEWQLSTFFFQLDQITESIALLITLDTLLLVAAWVLEQRHFIQEISTTTRTVIVSFSIAIISFIVSNLSFVTTTTPFSASSGLEAFYIRTLVDLLGYAALYAQYEREQESKIAHELMTIQTLLRSQHEQYLTSKRNIDTINRKYHDLRHIIAAMKAESDPNIRAAHLDQLEASVRPHGSTIRTGSPVLDVILTDKNQRCLDHDINMTVVADGEALDFMSTMDVATLVGNALDNAIEACLTIDDKQRRLIRFALHQQYNFVILRVENQIGVSPTFSADGSNLVTSKSNPTVHGFGLKSIRHTAEKYGGECTISVNNDAAWFTLRVLLPMQS